MKPIYLIGGGIAAALLAVVLTRKVQAASAVRNDAAGPRLPALPTLPSLPRLPAISGAAPNMPAMPAMPGMPMMPGMPVMGGAMPRAPDGIFGGIWG